jgi:cytochrome c biogenesis protein CcmG, thiol:disulfide interchange protein DsbE
MRRLVVPLLGIALVAVLVIGLTQAGGKADRPSEASRFDVRAATAKLAGAPAPLASLYKQPSALLDGGKRAFEQRIASLEGHPAVVNKWASWCRPCRAEFPVFQRVAEQRGKEVAFLGINGTDKRPAAERFLAERPLPYPSYEDPREDIAQARKAAKYYPMTLFIDERGKTAFIHTGEYTTTAQLNADIDRYLG